MRLRVQLVLAFFLLAVVPLAGISIYNYNSSLRALRQAAEEESAAMAAELGERMESVSTDLNHRIQRLGAFPFRTLMRANANPQDSPDKDVLVKQLMAQMGETASFLKALEFTPMAPPPAARVPPPAAFLGRPVAHGQRHPGLEMRGLVIHMPGDPDGQRRAEQDFGPNPDLNRSMMHIEVPMPAAPPSPPPPRP